MPKRLPSDMLERTTLALNQHPGGLALSDLHALFGDDVSRRSLQRRLEQWLRQGAIRGEGERRGRRYFNAARSDSEVMTPQPGQLTAAPATPAVQEGIPLSTNGRDIQGIVRRPITDRVPVGYERSFLERYVPNNTSYLTDTVRSHLQELGRTPDGDRPAGTYARDIFDRLLIDLSWSSSRLEGNTYSLLDTRELIERGTAALGKDAKETQMILNHKAAIEFLVGSAEEVGVNRYTLTNLHALLADNLLEDQRKVGRVRDNPIAIGASSYIPTAIPQLIEEMFGRVLELGAAIRDPFEQSFFMLVHIPYLQPFVDVNKRTSRLASNIPLVERNLVPLSFIDVPEQAYIDGLIAVYELNRTELLRDVFVWAYERSSRRYKTIRDSLPEPDPFRLEYRTALAEVVGEVVRRGIRAGPDTLRKLSRQRVSTEDLERFVQLVQAELDTLHEGNIARFRIRPSEFQQWVNRRK